MEEDFLKIIEKHDLKVEGCAIAAKEIASHMTEFTGWLRENADIGNYAWDIGDGEEYSDKGIYQYWRKHI